jgi:hypothetical protein
VAADHIDVRPRHEGGQAFQETLGVKIEVTRVVMPRADERADDAAGGEAGGRSCSGGGRSR